MRPARVALLAAGAERDDFGLALWPARAFQRDIERKQDFMEGHSESPLPACDRAGDEAGEIGFAAAKALRIRSRDIDGDIADRAGGRDTEPPVRPARERHNRFGAGFTGEADAARSKRKEAWRRNHA